MIPKEQGKLKATKPAAISTRTSEEELYQPMFLQTVYSSLNYKNDGRLYCTIIEPMVVLAGTLRQKSLAFSLLDGTAVPSYLVLKMVRFMVPLFFW